MGSNKTPRQNPDNPALKRGWMSLAAQAPIAGTPALIAQHPQDWPLQLAIDTVTVINGNGTRVRYTTPTLKGSSGSPCFDSSWNLIALHHGNEPSFKPTYNQGIPISAIAKLLAAHGHGAYVNG
jgi:V8-like Glu-specific endopeptidase